MHRQGRSWAEIGRLVGSKKLSLVADTYSHVMSDGGELDYVGLVYVGTQRGAPQIAGAISAAKMNSAAM